MKVTRTIIIGSGVAAVAVSRRLLQRNKSSEVVILEAGGDFPIGTYKSVEVYRNWLDFVMTNRSPTLKFQDGKQDADISGSGGFGVLGSRLIVRGGSTNHWGGWSLRMKPEDFYLGETRKTSISWPIGYKDLSHYYTDAEVFLGVCGDSNSTSVPRYGEKYPYDAVPLTALDQLLIPAFKDLKIKYESLPIARIPYQCQTTGTCRYCPVDARYAAGSDIARLLNEFPGRVELKINRPVLSIEMSSKKVASGVICRDQQVGTNEFIAGDRIVVAAGTIESAKLLLASRSQYWPSGVGNSHDHVGRHMSAHPLLRAVALVPNNSKHLEQEIDFPTMMCRHFDSETYQRMGKMFFVRDGKYVKFDEVSIADRLIMGGQPAGVDSVIENKTRIELRALVEAFPSDNNRVSIASGETSSGLPRSKIHYEESSDTTQARIDHMSNLQNILAKAGLKEPSSIESKGVRGDHATGTCRMSSEPQEGVVDSNLQIHETDNLFVCSNAVFPNSGAVNPTLTLVALALRLGDFLESSIVV